MHGKKRACTLAQYSGVVVEPSQCLNETGRTGRKENEMQTPRRLLYTCTANDRKVGVYRNPDYDCFEVRENGEHHADTDTKEEGHWDAWTVLGKPSEMGVKYSNVREGQISEVQVHRGRSTGASLNFWKRAGSTSVFSHSVTYPNIAAAVQALAM